MLRARVLAVGLLSWLPLLDCHTYDGPCSIAAAHYDQSCTVDSDCVAVPEVSACGGCACQTGAINKNALASYDSNSKGPLSQATGKCNCPCEGQPMCCGGVCTGSCGGCPPSGIADSGEHD